MPQKCTSRFSVPERLGWPAIATGLALSGCLTVEGIPVRDDDEDSDEKPVVEAGADDDSGSRPVEDAGPQAPDGDAGQDASMGIPCFDRGTYEIDGVSYRGMRETCDGDLVCLEGQCVPLPACEPGKTHECLYTPEGTHGTIPQFVFEGEYVYWLERGSVDDRNNPRYDGAVARTKVGEWTREELVAGLDFYDEAARRFLDYPGLLAKEGAVLWSVNSYSDVPIQYLVLSEQPASVRTLVTSNMLDLCSMDGVAYRARASELERLPLDGSQSSLLPLTGLDASGCVAGADTLLVHANNERRVELGESVTYVTLTPRQGVTQVTAERLWGRLADGWIGWAPNDGSTALTWTALAGPTKNYGHWEVTDTHVVWGGDCNNQAPRTEFAVFRTPLAGDGKQEVIAEVTREGTCTGMDFSPWGAIWWSIATPGAFYFAPMPPVLDDGK